MASFLVTRLSHKVSRSDVTRKKLDNSNLRIRYSLAVTIGRLQNPKVILPVTEKLQNPQLDRTSRTIYGNILRTSGELGRGSTDELLTAKEPAVRVSGVRLLFGVRDDAARKSLKLR